LCETIFVLRYHTLSGKTLYSRNI